MHSCDQRGCERAHLFVAQHAEMASTFSHTIPVRAPTPPTSTPRSPSSPSRALALEQSCPDSCPVTVAYRSRAQRDHEHGLCSRRALLVVYDFGGNDYAAGRRPRRRVVDVLAHQFCGHSAQFTGVI